MIKMIICVENDYIQDLVLEGASSLYLNQAQRKSIKFLLLLIFIFSFYGNSIWLSRLPSVSLKQIISCSSPFLLLSITISQFLIIWFLFFTSVYTRFTKQLHNHEQVICTLGLDNKKISRRRKEEEKSKITKELQGRIGIINKHFEVAREPLAGLRGRDHTVHRPAWGIESGGWGIWGSVWLSCNHYMLENERKE